MLSERKAVKLIEQGFCLSNQPPSQQTTQYEIKQHRRKSFSFSLYCVWAESSIFFWGRQTWLMASAHNVRIWNTSCRPSTKSQVGLVVLAFSNWQADVSKLKSFKNICQDHMPEWGKSKEEFHIHRRRHLSLISFNPAINKYPPSLFSDVQEKRSRKQGWNANLWLPIRLCNSMHEIFLFILIFPKDEISGWNIRSN